MAELTGMTVEYESGSHPHDLFLCRRLLGRVLHSHTPR
jgi:hypothetical protein